MMIIDRVVVRPDAAAPWVRDAVDGLVPQMAPYGRLAADPVHRYLDHDLVEVVLVWTLPDVAAWWALRRDAATVNWWRAQDETGALLRRDRDICAPISPASAVSAEGAA